MIASIVTTYRGPTSNKGGRVFAVATLATSGLKVRASRAWDHGESNTDNHRRAVFAALDKAGVIANAYVLDGFRDFWGVGHWTANTGDINTLLRKAENGLATLRQQYQEGETMDIREKYLDEIRDEMDKADYVISFLKGNLR
jgi:hypothetical protein